VLEKLIKLRKEVFDFLKEKGYDIDIEIIYTKSRGASSGRHYQPDEYRLAVRLFKKVALELFRVKGVTGASLINRSPKTFRNIDTKIRDDDKDFKNLYEEFISKYK
jgi:hypothetical protein